VSAEDAGLIMGIIAGPDPLDPTTLGAPAWNAKRARASPKGLRIGVPARFYVDDLESDIASALDRTIVVLRKLGAKISKVELPDQTVVSAAALIVLAVEATSAHAPWLRTRAADYVRRCVIGCRTDLRIARWSTSRRCVGADRRLLRILTPSGTWMWSLPRHRARSRRRS